MIEKTIKNLIDGRRKQLLIPSEKVATLSEDNYLEHAFLVLTKIGYSKIPVLDKSQHFKGLLSLSMITESMIKLNMIDSKNLCKFRVSEVMQSEVDTIHLDENIENMLHLLIDQSFLVVVDDNDIFLGIITRKKIIKIINYLIHELSSKYIIKKHFI